MKDTKMTNVSYNLVFCATEERENKLNSYTLTAKEKLVPVTFQDNIFLLNARQRGNSSVR